MQNLQKSLEELTGCLDTAPLRAIPRALWKRMENEEGAVGSEKAMLSQGAGMSQARHWAHGSEQQEDVCRQLLLGEGLLLHVLCFRHKSQFFLKLQLQVLPSTLHAELHSAVLCPAHPCGHLWMQRVITVPVTLCRALYSFQRN